MALVDMFLKLDGVEGESPDPGHKSEIQIEGFSMSARHARDVATNMPTGAAHWSPLTIRARIDKSTPKLFQKLAKNEKIPTATLTCRKAGKEQFEYFKIILSEVLIVRVQPGELDVGDQKIPSCEFDLGYAKIEMQAKEQTTTGPTSGPIMFQYNLGANA